MSTCNVRLVVNPGAGGGRIRALVPEVAEVLRGHGWQVTICEADPGDAERLAGEAHPDTIVCSLGGYGTHARVASGAYVAGARFAPLPGGRGNDLIRALGLPTHPLDAARHLAQATERRIDLGDVNGTPFLGVVSIGASAIANEIANTSRLRGPRTYHLAAARGTRHARRTPYRLRMDDRVLEVEAMEVVVGLSGWYGGGMRVCPHAVMDDGLLDVTIIPGPRSLFPRAVWAMFNGRLDEVPGVQMYQARTVHVEGEGPVYADGDPVGRLPLTATVSPQALRLLA